LQIAIIAILLPFIISILLPVIAFALPLVTAFASPLIIVSALLPAVIAPPLARLFAALFFCFS